MRTISTGAQPFQSVAILYKRIDIVDLGKNKISANTGLVASARFD